jgi:hypothetical protein
LQEFGSRKEKLLLLYGVGEWAADKNAVTTRSLMRSSLLPLPSQMGLFHQLVMLDDYGALVR